MSRRIYSGEGQKEYQARYIESEAFGLEADWLQTITISCYAGERDGEPWSAAYVHMQCGAHSCTFILDNTLHPLFPVIPGVTYPTPYILERLDAENIEGWYVQTFVKNAERTDVDQDKKPRLFAPTTQKGAEILVQDFLKKVAEASSEAPATQA